jgi:hypothetical protein
MRSRHTRPCKVVATEDGHDDTGATAASADEPAIHDVSRAYLEAWLDGDGERMHSAPGRHLPPPFMMTS